MSEESNNNNNKLSLIRVKRKIGDLPPDSLLVNIPKKKQSIIQSFQSLSTQHPDESIPPQPQVDSAVESNNNNKRHKLYRLVDTITSDLLHVYSPDQLKHKIDSLRQESETFVESSSEPQTHTQVLQQQQQQQQQPRILKAHRYKQVKIDVPELKTKLNEHSATYEILDVQVFDTPERKPPSVRRNAGSHAPPPTPQYDESSVDELSEDVLSNFYPMVKEYLKTRDSTLLPTPTTTTITTISHQTTSTTSSSTLPIDGDYVIDFYLQDTQNSPTNGIPEVHIEPFDEDLGLEDEYVNDSDDGNEKNVDTDTDSENRGSDYPDEEDDGNDKIWGYEENTDNSDGVESDEEKNWGRNRNDEDSESYDLDDYENDDVRRYENRLMMPYDPEFDD